MPDITGLPAFADGVAQYLQGNGVTATVVLGWRENVQLINEGDGTANRIVIQPGDPQGGAGELAAPRQVGTGPRTIWPPLPVSGPDAQSPDDVVGRELADWAERATVFVWAADASAPEDERRQYIAVRGLLTWFQRAAVYVARNAVELGDLEWVDSKDIEKQYGRELAIAMVYHSPLFDLADELVHPTNVAPTGAFVTTG